LAGLYLPSEVSISIVATSDVKKLSPTSEQSRSAGRLWLLFTGVSVLLILMAATRWILDHPYGIHWDEALYFNQAVTNIWKFKSENLHKIGGVFLSGDSSRPPAYRVLVLPLLALFGFKIAVARFVSLALSSVSAWLIYLATRRVGSPVAGAFAVLVFSLSPDVVSASIFFSSDAPLYLASSAMLYFLFVHWSDRSINPGNWVGLGLAIGLGFLSKTSFVLIAFPVLAFALIAGRRRLGVPGLAFLLKAGALAFLIAAPWWLLNIRNALRYAKFAMDAPRNSLGPSSLHIWAQWLGTVALGLLGPGLTIVIVLVAVFAFHQIIITRKTALDPVQRTALIACLCAALPLVVVQLTGTNHLLRYLTPAVIPLAITVGVLADKTGWARCWLSIAASAFCFVAQLVMLTAPVVFPNTQPVDPGFKNGGLPWRIMVRFDQWNWKPLRDISDTCAIETPRISYLGNGRAFNPPQLQYPWVVRGSSPPDATWLWRYEDGPVDWTKVMGSIGQSDIVLTAPHYVGQVTDWQDLDNQHNAEFSERLAQDARFRGPIRLEMGRFEPIEVLVFLKKTLVCHSAGEGQAKR